MMAASQSQREREFIADFIDKYKELPCLWDLSSPHYMDKGEKKSAWGVLVKKYKEFDDNANEATVKKKIENLKSSYQREARKVKESSNRTGSATSELYKPNLWYFELMAFLDNKKEELRRTGIDSLMSEDDDDRPTEASGKRRKQKEKISTENHQKKLLETAENLLKEKKHINPFGLYVGETLNNISPDQREIAEKLISDVLFLARRNNLNIESKIESNSRHSNQPHYNSSPYFIQSPFSQSPHSSSDVFSNPSQTHHRKFVYAPQITQRLASPIVYSPTDNHTEPSIFSSSPSQAVVTVASPITYSPVHTQSPPSQIQIPNPSPSFHSSQNTATVASPVTYSPVHMQSPPSQIQVPNPSPSFYSSQHTVTIASPIVYSPRRIELPSTSTEVQHPNHVSPLSVTHSPFHTQISHSTSQLPTIHIPEARDHPPLAPSTNMDNERVTILDNTVVPSDSAGDILREMLLFKK